MVSGEVEGGSLVLVEAGGASVAGGWGFGVTAPLRPSTGHAETADGHTTIADAAIPATGENSVREIEHSRIDRVRCIVV